MIFSAIARDDPDMMFTIVKRGDMYQSVGLSAEEMFRAVLGDKEFERRVAVAFGETPPSPHTPPPIEPPSIRSYVRKLNLKRNT